MERILTHKLDLFDIGHIFHVLRHASAQQTELMATIICGVFERVTTFKCGSR